LASWADCRGGTSLASIDVARHAGGSSSGWSRREWVTFGLASVRVGGEIIWWVALNALVRGCTKAAWTSGVTCNTELTEGIEGLICAAGGTCSRWRGYNRDEGNDQQSKERARNYIEQQHCLLEWFSAMALFWMFDS